MDGSTKQENCMIIRGVNCELHGKEIWIFQCWRKLYICQKQFQEVLSDIMSESHLDDLMSEEELELKNICKIQKMLYQAARRLLTFI